MTLRAFHRFAHPVIREIYGMPAGRTDELGGHGVASPWTMPDADTNLIVPRLVGTPALRTPKVGGWPTAA
jgi:hypothetical protein